MSDYVHMAVERMLCAGAALSPDGEAARAAARALLADPVDGVRRGGVSALNGDGTPLQLCLSSSRSGSRLRWIADPAWEVADPDERLLRSTEALDGLLVRAGADALAGAAHSLIARLVPDDAAARRAYRRGFLWLAGGIGTPGAAIYLEMAPHGAAAWGRAAAWLLETLPDPMPALVAINPLRPHATLASVGIEGTAPGDARFKLYFRLTHAVQLGTLGIELLGSPALAALLTAVVGERPMPFSGAVFGLGFALATGAAADAKLDLCAHCTEHAPRDWIAIANRLAMQLGVEPIGREVCASIEREDVAVGLLGAGIDTAGRTRLNLYLRTPRPRPSIAPSPASAARSAVDRAIRHLDSIRNDDGSWHDYRLPVGAATEWVTAFVGLAMATAGRRNARAALLAAEAADRLVRVRAYPAGWGYNGRTGPDADSTAFALRLLAATGRRADARDSEWLLSRWQDGGFATYDGPLAWGNPHPCVTAAAFPALDDRTQRALRPALLRAIAHTRRDDGTWPAYWWRTHHYSTYHHLRLLAEIGGAVVPAEIVNHVYDLPLSAFEVAYAAGIAHRTGNRAERDRALARLLAMQSEDGSFPGAANLRVTDPDCFRPWETPRGALYVDERATITTASAILILSEVTDD